MIIAIFVLLILSKLMNIMVQECVLFIVVHGLYEYIQSIRLSDKRL